MSGTSNEETIRVIRFSGKTEDWPYWEEKFLSRARRKGYKSVLLGKDKVVTDADAQALDLTKPDDKAKSEIRKSNELAFEEMILAIDTSMSKGRVAFKLVKGCKSSDYQDGNAAAAWKKLQDKYVPKSAPSLL